VGAYLCRLLVEDGLKVVAAARHIDDAATARLARMGMADRVELGRLDVTDLPRVTQLISELKPDEIYNLASISSVAASYRDPAATAQVNGMAALNILEAVRLASPATRVLQPSSSEMYRRADPLSDAETNRLDPTSPYGAAKAFAHMNVGLYREAFGVHACCAVMFNVESPLREPAFVTRRISMGMAKAAADPAFTLRLGSLDIERDMGFAGDYVVAMRRMLEQDLARDFVLATGEAHSIREFAGLAAREAGFDLVWSGAGMDEVGACARTGRVLVRIDPELYRPIDVRRKTGDPGAAERLLGWRREVGFEELARMMVREDLGLRQAA
jgi:GDPmannose 4,6-dehydratase